MHFAYDQEVSKLPYLTACRHIHISVRTRNEENFLNFINRLRISCILQNVSVGSGFHAFCKMHQILSLLVIHSFNIDAVKS